jgi:hypothetical protein
MNSEEHRAQSKERKRMGRIKKRNLRQDNRINRMLGAVQPGIL